MYIHNELVQDSPSPLNLEFCSLYKQITILAHNHPQGRGQRKVQRQSHLLPTPLRANPIYYQPDDDKTLRRHTALHAFPLHGQPRPSLAGSAKCGKKGKDAATEKADEKHQRGFEGQKGRRCTKRSGKHPQRHCRMVEHPGSAIRRGSM